MSRLIIHRSSEFTNRFRQYNIYVDGVRVGGVANGQDAEFNIGAGRHTLVSKIDWCSSPEINFEIGENQTAHFKVGGFKHARWIMPLAILIIVASVIVRRTTGYDYVYYLVIPPFMVLLYYITFGRKKYLTLQEGGSIF